MSATATAPKSRIEETMHFAQLLGVKKIGIATCAGLIHETNALARVLRAQGYEVTGIACKCGMVNKTELGIPERCLEVGQNICNPVLQALVLNGEGDGAQHCTRPLRRARQSLL